MITTRLATPIVAPRRLTHALRLLPAAALFAGLVLGGPSLTEDSSTRLEAMPEYCRENPKDCINTGDNSGDGTNFNTIVAPVDTI